MWRYPKLPKLVELAEEGKTPPAAETGFLQAVRGQKVASAKLRGNLPEGGVEK